LDVRSGEALWEKEIGSMQNMLLAGDYLFLVSNKNFLYAINKDAGEIAWTKDLREHIFEEDFDMKVFSYEPIMIDGHILLPFSNGLVFKINASTGNIVAKTLLDTGIGSSLIVANQSVIAVSDKADIIVLK
ncbi:MAG: hypothetical protein IKW39_01805, partial [Alphaproteobacteria bacterium]|nr:hypothetical protein [Alphaproteobacteria bacterium]